LMRRKVPSAALFRYVFDASSLINIERHGLIPKLKQLKDMVLMPKKVADEIDQPNSPLSRFIHSCPEVVTDLMDGEDQEYLRVRRQPGIDDGEAAVIAVAIRRHLPVVIDDAKGKAKAESHGIQTLRWTDFFAKKS